MHPATAPLAQPLSTADLAHWREHGWIGLGRVLDDAQLAGLRAAEARFREHPLDRDNTATGQLTLFRNLIHDRSEAAREVCTRGHHLAQVRSLLGPDVLLWYNQLVTKLPDRDGASVFPWHQDNGYVALEPADNVTVWIALDDVDTGNGCVWIQPGSHHRGLLPHVPVSPDSWHKHVIVAGDGIPAPLRAGEAVAFTGLTLHRSLANRTDRPRRAFFIEYARADAVEAESRKPLVEAPHSWVVCGELRGRGR